MREEMKDEAAEEGAPVRTQTVGSRTDRASRKPIGCDAAMSARSGCMVKNLVGK